MCTSATGAGRGSELSISMTTPRDGFVTRNVITTTTFHSRNGLRPVVQGLATLGLMRQAQEEQAMKKYKVALQSPVLIIEASSPQKALELYHEDMVSDFQSGI